MEVKTTIRKKISSRFITTSSLLVLVLGIISMATAISIYSRDINDLMFQHGEQIAYQIENDVWQRVSIMEIRVETENLSTIPLQNIKSLIDGMISEDKTISELSLVDASGQELYRASRLTKVKEVDLVNLAKIPGFSSVIKSGKSFVSTVESTSKGPVTAIITPFKNKDGVVIGALIGQVNLSQLETYLKQVPLGQEGYVTLVDDKNNIIATSQDKPIPSKSLIDQLTNNKTAHKKGISFIYRDSQIKIGNISLLSDPQWRLVSSWPITDAYRPLLWIVLEIIVVMIVGFVTTSIIASRQAKELAQPLEQMRLLAEEIGRGKFDQRVDIKTGDEIQILGETINGMSAKIVEQIKTITEKERRIMQQKDEFLFIAAHELNTPVTALKYSTETLEESFQRRDSALFAKSMDYVNIANKQLIQLVSNLLEIARTDAGTLKVDTSPTDIVVAIEKSVKSLTHAAKQRKVAVKFEKPTCPFIVIGDERRLIEVFNNLISNGIKYNKEEGGVVRITINEEVNEVAVVVADSGRGIAKEDIGHLFQRFFRTGSANQQKKTEGTGLGLFITKQLVEKMGGTISVDSELGKGTAFTVKLKKEIKNK